LSLNAGVRVGPYEILAPLGAGGMGEVYRARDGRLNREIALKILSTENTPIDALRRFEQEARAASALNHPNIITIYDIGRVEPLAYIGMELIEGRDVRSMMAGERLPLKHVLRIAVKVADGLAAAHERGIVHRDLKPENVMVNRDGYVKILDFGLAKLVRPISDTETTLPHTTPGAVFGTVGYMSPEQASGKAIDFRSDQFALGVILYEMLTGRLPFSAATAPETLAAIIRDEPVPIVQLNPLAPPELARIVSRCLSKDPEDRYASTRDLVRDLRETRDRITNASDTRHRTSPRIAVQPRAMAAVALIAALVAFAGGVFWMFRERGVATAPARSNRSIAVLPFRDLSGTPEGQIFSNGITEMVAARLAEPKVIRVLLPPNGGDQRESDDPAATARARGAGLALRGAVQRMAGQIRITYGLVDATSGEQVAGETVTGAAGDVFALQDLVAERILRALEVEPQPRRLRSASSELTEPADQRAYIEAVGLLQRPKDLASVDRAIATLERLLKNVARDSATVNGLLGRALLFKSQISRTPELVEQATVYAERAAALDADLPEVQVTVGQLRNVSGRHDEAVTAFEAALALRPDMSDAVIGLADAHAAAGRSADAERQYKRALALRRDDISAWNKYGFFCYTRGRHEEAAQNFRQVTELAPDWSTGHANLGGAYQALGRYDDALRSYQRSIEIQPSAPAWSNIGTIHYSLGRYDEAVKAFEKASDLAPHDYLIWSNLGDAYRWAPGRRNDASRAYTQAVLEARSASGVNPKDALVPAVVAACHAKMGDMTAASREIANALRLDPTNAQVLYYAAVVAHLRGNTPSAVTWLQRAVDAGYSSDEARRDPEMQSLRDDPSFRSALERPKA
jgi:tetratricopeptide (TPR) repeat protein/TolB-like protein